MRPTVRRLVGVVAAAGLAAGLFTARAEAQTTFQVGVRGTYIPLNSGNATFGRAYGTGVTTQAAVAFGTGGTSELEAFYTLVPRSDRSPRIQLAGALFSLSRGIESRLTGVGTVGLGVSDWASGVSGPCVGFFCSPDGIRSFGNGRYPTVIAGLGVEAQLLPSLRLRADLRQHLPVGADDADGESGKRRSDIGLGLRYLFGLSTPAGITVLQRGQ